MESNAWCPRLTAAIGGACLYGDACSHPIESHSIKPVRIPPGLKRQLCGTLKRMNFAEPIKLIKEKPCPRILFRCADTLLTESAWKITGQMFRQRLRAL